MSASTTFDRELREVQLDTDFNDADFNLTLNRVRDEWPLTFALVNFLSSFL